MQKTYGSSCATDSLDPRPNPRGWVWGPDYATDAIVLQPEVAIVELNLHAVRPSPWLLLVLLII